MRAPTRTRAAGSMIRCSVFLVMGAGIWLSAADAPVENLAKSAPSRMKVTGDDRQHWSFLPLHAVVPPTVRDAASVQTPVDQFIRQALESKGMTPSASADARTLVRRIYFDLVGLPPTPEEM